MFKDRAVAVLALVAIGVSVSCTPVRASGSRTTAHYGMRTFAVKLRAAPDAQSTFWVAYGPVGGHFGLLRLQHVARLTYRANSDVVITARTVYTFLQGEGVLVTRMGEVPGNPVTVIKSFAPRTLVDGDLPAVRWMPPVG